MTDQATQAPTLTNLVQDKLALLSNMQEIETELNTRLKGVRTDIAFVRGEILEALKADKVKTLQLDDARVSVRTTKTQYVKEGELVNWLNDEGKWDATVKDAVWPRTFDKPAAVGFALANTPDLVHVDTKETVVITKG